ncbi:basement membrane-specific heparan sulfate proteoglycan core protein-like [Bacillus rossius redtenbacheri]|uniref:basement membrane-specific heparan sulfate proteoglycan core protein-like n=1 Tax=Bacillus rossius redtenbacheri TaxID=93214 RepID=UPI002FDE9E37
MANESAATPLISRITHIVLHGVMGSVLLTWSPQPHDEPAVTTPTVAPPSGNETRPHYHPHGTFFEDGPRPLRVTARVGSTVTLDCKVAMLQGKTVTWLHRDGGRLRLLTVGRQSYSADGRLQVLFRYPGNWRLRSSSAHSTAVCTACRTAPTAACRCCSATRATGACAVAARTLPPCALHGLQVTWLHRDGGRLRLLTVGRQSYSADGRLQVLFRYPGNWRLRIAGLAPADQGEYRCQVSAHPPLVKTVLLVVTAPVLAVVDDAGRPVGEDRYYKAGSRVELSCEASSLQPGDTVAWSRRGRPLAPSEDEPARARVSGSSAGADPASGAATATLTIAHAQRAHSGDYTCAVGGVASVSVAVHILKGQLPAAVHHGKKGGGATRLLGAPRLAALLACVAALVR